MAKSIAISMPCARASATRRSNCASVPSSGWIASCPPSLAADRPRAARIVRAGGERVVPSLAVRLPDRMNRRQVDDVEAELGELRQQRAHALEAAPRTREELVPRPEACELAVDVHHVHLGRRRAGAIAGGRRKRLLDGERRAPEQHGSLGELARQVVLATFRLAPDLVLIGGDPVGPRLDPERPQAGPVDDERAGPRIVAERRERRLLPAGRARPAGSGRRRRATSAPSRKIRAATSTRSPAIRFTG